MTPEEKNVLKNLAVAVLSLIAVAAFAAPSSHAASKPRFPAGTWIGNGDISGGTTEYGQERRTSGKASFRLKVTRGGRVSGSGRWETTETGSGAISATIATVAPVDFSGTPRRPTYAGTQTVTTSFSDEVHDDGNTFTLPFSGALEIKRARRCRVTGEQTVDGVSLTWTARLKGCGS